MARPGRKRAAGTRRSGLFDIVRWELPKTARRRAASSAVLILRSAHATKPAANPGARARVSKDEAAVHPSCFETAASPPPQHEGVTVLGMRASRLREWDVLQSQGCGGSLFSSCSVLLSAAKSGLARDAARADFPFGSHSLRAKGTAPGCGRPPVFLLLFTGTTAPRGSPSHVAAAAADHYLTRYRRGRG